MYGAIINKGEQYYTDLYKVFNAINNVQKNYNWLITDCVCYPSTKQFAEILSNEYCWLSGSELTRIVEKENFQWIWAVLSGFDKSITLDEVLEYPLPLQRNIQDFGKIQFLYNILWQLLKLFLGTVHLH